MSSTTVLMMNQSTYEQRVWTLIYIAVGLTQTIFIGPSIIQIYKQRRSFFWLAMVVTWVIALINATISFAAIHTVLVFTLGGPKTPILSNLFVNVYIWFPISFTGFTSLRLFRTAVLLFKTRPIFVKITMAAHLLVSTALSICIIYPGIRITYFNDLSVGRFLGVFIAITNFYFRIITFLCDFYFVTVIRKLSFKMNSTSTTSTSSNTTGAKTEVASTKIPPYLQVVYSFLPFLLTVFWIITSFLPSLGLATFSAYINAIVPGIELICFLNYSNRVMESAFKKG